MYSDWHATTLTADPPLFCTISLANQSDRGVPQILDSIYKTFLRPARDLSKLGKYAVITGATDGIGKAYALALAKKKMSIVLISRTEAKLKEVKAEIDAKGYQGVDVKYVVCDYSQFHDKAVQGKVRAELDKLDIGVLINNVGVSYRYPMYFDELSDQEVTDLLTLNVESVVYMTRMVLPNMLSKRKGTIVNISSGSALYTLPLLAEYSGAKSFVEKFSRALNAEYKSKGITCQCQVPFYVATKLAKMRRSVMVPSPDEYVACALKWVGYADNAVVSPFYLHAIQGYLMHKLPDSIVSSQIMSMHLAIRKKGKKKDEQGESSKTK
jgi:17beta-estradiol 17-dehydrogenase / very-long-chain 3-oxoacyl-CoA reductase